MSKYSQAETQALNHALAELLSERGLNGDDYSSVFSDLFASTSSPVNLYVDSINGSDNGFGTQNSPLASISAAVALIPKNIYHSVDIHLAPGNYAGAIIDGFVIHSGPSPSSVIPYFNIVGSMAPVIPVGGTGSGLLTGFTAGTLPAFDVLIDSSQSWVVNELKGKFVEITSGTGFSLSTISTPTIYPILSNTATSITVPNSGAIAGIGSGYRLRSISSIINSASTFPANTTNPALLTQNQCGLLYLNNIGSGYSFNQLAFALSTSCPRPATFGNTRLRANIISVTSSTGASGGFVTSVGNFPSNSIFVLSNFYSQLLTGTGTHITATGGITGAVSGAVTISGGIMENGINGMSITGAGASVSVCSIKNVSNIGISAASQAGMNLTGVVIDTASVKGIYNGGDIFAVGVNTGILQTNACDISNCPIAIYNEGPLSAVKVIATSGTGNTLAISCVQGSKLKLSANSSITGSTELSVDGSTSTIATMRSASPKTTVPNNYGTLIFE